MSGILAGVTNRDQRKILAQAQSQGCALSWTARGHVRVDTPNGPVFAAGTSKSWRATNELRAALRRRGVDV